MLDRAETELDFYSRRAMEEAHAAAGAASVVVGATHRHMAAAYAAKLRNEQETAAIFEELVNDLEQAEAAASHAQTDAMEDEETVSPIGDPSLDA